MEKNDDASLNVPACLPSPSACQHVLYRMFKHVVGGASPWAHPPQEEVCAREDPDGSLACGPFSAACVHGAKLSTPACYNMSTQPAII